MQGKVRRAPTDEFTIYGVLLHEDRRPQYESSTNSSSCPEVPGLSIESSSIFSAHHFLQHKPPPSCSKMTDISKLVASQRPDLDPYISIYKHIHSHPELSGLEAETAKLVVSHLKKISSDFDIHEGIGGHGVAAVLRNGDGPTVLVRADMDALPELEATGVDYASKVRMKDLQGVDQPVMHACGHDMHTTALLAAAELLVSADSRKAWSGTLLLVWQPAEETGTGAQAMVDDGLYKQVPIPDVVLAGHVMPSRAGTVGIKKGLTLSSADCLKITMYGRGGHASQPHHLIDPVVMAASTIVRLQTIVSRETDPGENTVLTVGSIQAGETANVIADEAVIQLNIRTQTPATREKVLSSIERIVKAESLATGATKDPKIEKFESYPFTFNDEETTAKLGESFAKHFSEGPQKFTAGIHQLLNSEDFTNLGELHETA